ncbi:MAG: tRNA-dihydrouridine synthase family protein [Lachnospiraceae bacterium]|nr:tRNA-dihydrouridine synthase family protein [Lachnospiraceae bacterium]
MKFFFAPMEGITKYPFRRVHHERFPGIDAYYMPFIVANQTMSFKQKERKDIDPANNAGVPAVPQVLTNKPDQFLNALQMLAELGYCEVNFNLGCPMATEVSKKKGAGFLSVPEELDRFFDGVFNGINADSSLSEKNIRLSVKTRIGVEEAAESVRLMEIFNRYPISRLIIHARRRVDFYKGEPDLDTFGEMLAASVHPVSYNGDLFAPEDLIRLEERFPGLDSVMIGRGLIRNPALVREMKGGPQLEKDELAQYLNALFEAYREVIHEENNVVHKMKELWFYLGENFPENKKQLKRIMKAKSTAEYRIAAEELLETVSSAGN